MPAAVAGWMSVESIKELRRQLKGADDQLAVLLSMLKDRHRTEALVLYFTQVELAIDKVVKWAESGPDIIREAERGSDRRVDRSALPTKAGSTPQNSPIIANADQRSPKGRKRKKPA